MKRQIVALIVQCYRALKSWISSGRAQVKSVLFYCNTTPDKAFHSNTDHSPSPTDTTNAMTDKDLPDTPEESLHSEEDPEVRFPEETDDASEEVLPEADPTDQPHQEMHVPADGSTPDEEASDEEETPVILKDIADQAPQEADGPVADVGEAIVPESVEDASIDVDTSEGERGPDADSLSDEEASVGEDQVAESPEEQHTTTVMSDSLVKLEHVVEVSKQHYAAAMSVTKRFVPATDSLEEGQAAPEDAEAASEEHVEPPEVDVPEDAVAENNGREIPGGEDLEAEEALQGGGDEVVAESVEGDVASENADTDQDLDPDKNDPFAEEDEGFGELDEDLEPVEMLGREESRQALYALLFVSDRPMSAKRLAEALGDMDTEIVVNLLDEIQEEIENNTLLPYTLREIAGGYQLMTKSEFAPYIRRLFQIKKSKRLSKALMETLAIIAYKQPVTRAEVEAIRGVSVSHAFEQLQDRRMIKVTGVSDLPGRPKLYRTTEEFLLQFGLGNLHELPSLEELQEME